MTSPVSPSETIAKALEGEFRRAAVNLVDTLVLERETNGQSKEFMDWAVFMTVSSFEEQLSAIALKLEAMERRAEDAEALAERLKLEAQAHAMEARTANSTINEIYQVVSGGNGEPGNWHGATPVRERLEAMQREMAELREVRAGGRDAAATLHDALMAERALTQQLSTALEMISAESKESNEPIGRSVYKALATCGEIADVALRARTLIQGEKK